MEYYGDGTLRLEAPNLRTYCGNVDPAVKVRLETILIETDLDEGLRSFGTKLRYPACFIPDTLTVEIRGREATARIDALEGELLALAVVLETEFLKAFGSRYSISIVEYATQQECRGTDGRPRDPSPL